MEGGYTLVFDIGKTAKKVLLLDRYYNVVHDKTEFFSETIDDDGFPCEDIGRVAAWVRDSMRECTGKYPQVTALNFSAYGASLVHLDERNRVIPPFYNYLKPFSEDIRAEFLAAHDYTDDISSSTASPWLGMLNSGLQLYWLKNRKSAKFGTIRTSLHLPQFFSFMITGEMFADITSVGCHTLLWDFRKNTYHQWVLQEGIVNLFAPLQMPDHRVFADVGGKRIRTGIGVHDSSAALMPYLVAMKERFLLLSTGTWNIAFNPFNHELLSHEELRRDCLSYLTFQGNAVKASRIFLGHEHDLQVKAIARHFNIDNDFCRNVCFDRALYEKSQDESAQRTVYSIGMTGTGPLPEKEFNKTNWSSFDSAGEAYHAMVLQLVKWQMISLELIDPGNRIQNVIIVGGFTGNKVFLECLKRKARHLKIYLSDHPHAAALGAAWLVNEPHTYDSPEAILNIRQI